jgi:hypothetical protein
VQKPFHVRISVEQVAARSGGARVDDSVKLPDGGVIDTGVEIIDASNVRRFRRKRLVG